jgi:hypothetical protein
MAVTFEQLDLTQKESRNRTGPTRIDRRAPGRFAPYLLITYPFSIREIVARLLSSEISSHVPDASHVRLCWAQG